MGLNRISNSGFGGTRGSKLLSTMVPIPWALATGGTTTDISYQGQTIRQHIFDTSSSLTVLRAGFITLFVVASGGSGGIRNPGNQDPGYPGGGGGGGGYYFNENYYLTPATYTVTVGAAASGGAIGNDSAFGTIVCGGGGNGGVSLQGSQSPVGRPGSGGGGTGATGGPGASPGIPSTNGPGYFDFMRTYWDTRYALPGAGATANSGNGGSQGQGSSSGSGRCIVRYILTT